MRSASHTTKGSTGKGRRLTMDKEHTVTEILEEVKNDICDNYCKYPEEYEDYEDMLKERCNDCVLKLL